MGLALHQATRSEHLVNLVQFAGHFNGLDTVRRIDATIATSIINKFQEKCIYIPDDIVPYTPGHLILASCDNIPVLEDTIDGKNSFHCTQMMLWQHCPPPRGEDSDTLTEGSH